MQDRNEQELTPIEEAAANGNIAEVHRLKEEDEEVKKTFDQLIIEMTANPSKTFKELENLIPGLKKYDYASDRAVRDHWLRIKRNHKNALILAASAGHANVVEELLTSKAIEKKDTPPKTHGVWCPTEYTAPQELPIIHTALKHALDNHHMNAAIVLLKNGAMAGIQSAAESGNDVLLDMLLSYKNASNESIIAAEANAALKSVVFNNKPTILGLLLENGVDANYKILHSDNPKYSNDYSTPLGVAAKYGYINIVRILLNHGANVDEKQPYSSDATPLNIAARHCFGCVTNGEDSIGVIKALLENGANIKEKNKKGETALMSAVEKNFNIAIVNILLDHYASLMEKDKSDKSLDVKDREGQTALMKAIQRYDTGWMEETKKFSAAVVNRLLAMGVDVDPTISKHPLIEAYRQQVENKPKEEKASLDATKPVSPKSAEVKKDRHQEKKPDQLIIEQTTNPDNKHKENQSVEKAFFDKPTTSPKSDEAEKNKSQEKKPDEAQYMTKKLS